MSPVLGFELVFNYVSFVTVLVQVPSEQILIDLRILSQRNMLSTSVKIEPLKDVHG
jgi:hypothetical protein